MAQNVIINGVTYQNVPEVNIPKVGGGTAKFTDTSDATLANGSQIRNGVSAYGANGAKMTGTMTEKAAQTYTPTVTVKTPAIYARCNASYFAVARAPELDKAASKFRLVGKVYRVEKEDAAEAMYREFYERYNAEQ